MNKKILIGIGILIITIILTSGCIREPTTPTKEQLNEKFSAFKIQYDEKKAEGYDITKAEDFARKAKQAFDRGDYIRANELLEEAFIALEKAEIPAFPVPTPSLPTEEWLFEGPIYITSLVYYPCHSFNELTQSVPELKELGIKTIYLTPIWESDTGPGLHQVHDYYKIDPYFGSSEDLKNLVETAHKHNIKILLDLVITYTHKNSWICNNHPEWILHDSKTGEMLHFWPDPATGYAIDMANPGVIEYFAEVARYYVEEYNIDGWRVDIARNNYDPKFVSGDHSGTNLLRRVKEEVTKVKPNAILLPEYPGPEVIMENPKADPLFDEMCEISYDRFLTGPTELVLPRDIENKIKDIKRIQRFAIKEGRGLTSEENERINELQEEINTILRERYDITSYASLPDLITKLSEKVESRYPGFIDNVLHNDASSENLVNFFSNENILHDRTRARWIETHDSKIRVQLGFPNQHRSLLVLVSTVLGVPMIHAGQEIGETKDTWYSRTPVDWTNGDHELRDFYKKVFEIRSENDALKYGTIENVWKSGDNTYAYLRSYENNKVVVVLNFQDRTATSTLDLPFNAGDILYDALNDESFVANNPSDFEITLPAYGSRILVLQK
jgi:glycosidase